MNETMPIPAHRAVRDAIAANWPRIPDWQINWIEKWWAEDWTGPITDYWSRRRFVAQNTTQTGIPIIDCDVCGKRHPATRTHCPVCGSASLFGHGECS